MTNETSKMDDAKSFRHDLSLEFILSSIRSPMALSVVLLSDSSLLPTQPLSKTRSRNIRMLKLRLSSCCCKHAADRSLQLEKAPSIGSNHIISPCLCDIPPIAPRTAVELAPSRKIDLILSRKTVSLRRPCPRKFTTIITALSAWGGRSGTLRDIVSMSDPQGIRSGMSWVRRERASMT